ncbi:hypothetical protein SAY87_013834 [Trapa incisa]|uniref:Uncharacterized protein n=1 Tax=Trapa incisa TaxID=236973 RepID=A0AAN7KCL1_9MYRT|nr:hypothetical protein SAY87_013834 [Trapa incisa]
MGRFEPHVAWPASALLSLAIGGNRLPEILGLRSSSDFSFCSAHLISNALLVFFVLDFQSSPSTAFDRHCVPLLLEPINRDASMEA